jgi:hypothetical protein
MELEREAPQSIIFSGTPKIDVPSLRTFLEILLGNNPEYDSDDIDCCAPPHMLPHRR